ncbi:MAG: IS3 family transposase [Oscillospiraceae bacterium]|nr:IS3 family transposase [Oscillospiraceae bacterium]
MENEALTEMIENIFHENKGRYGARRIQKVLEQHVKVKPNGCPG